MPLLAILVGLVCGLISWVVLDQVQPRALKSIFAQELSNRMDQQARETLIRFESYVSSHISTIRLLANHQVLAHYLEPVYWFRSDRVRPIVYRQLPPWLPSASLWQPLVKPSHVLLLDTHNRIREIYQEGEQSLPIALAAPDQFFLTESRVQAELTAFEGQPYLLVSETAEDATGMVMGKLMMVTPVDMRFLQASQLGGLADGVLVALLDADEQRFLSSSDSSEVTSGMTMAKATEDYLVTAQSFYQYEGSTLNVLFATLVHLQQVEAMREQVGALERRQRLVAAVTFVGIFTLVFYLLSERLKRTLHRISRFSVRALGIKQPLFEKGNQLLVLEDWIRQFIQMVRETRDEMRQRHESEMQESEALKRAIMETSLDSLISIDQNGLIIEFNTTAEQTFGYRRSEVLGKDFADLVLDTDSRPQFFQKLVGCLNQSAFIADDYRQDMTAIRADGSSFPVELSIKPITLKSQVVFTVYMHDITARRRAEEKIRSLAKFPSESPSPVLRVNRPGVILYANPASGPLLEYLGCERGQTLPLYWKKRVFEVFESGENWETQITFGDYSYSLLLTPVVDLDYLNIYGRDITAVRDAERQAREHQQELVHVCRLSTMGEMATGLAHELNQPLSAIANYANGSVRRLQLKAKEKESSEILYALGQINNQADRAGEIIKRLRSLVAKQPPVRSVADMNQVIQEVCSFVEFEARKTGVVIEQELNLAPLFSRIDVVQIEQVLLNLVRNALDALLEVPEEERRLVIRSGTLDGGAQVMVEVEDSGPGIKKKNAKHMFEPFFTTKESGMGMGLVISQTIVEDHNGMIEMKSAEGRGTRFSMILPSHCEQPEELELAGYQQERG